MTKHTTLIPVTRRALLERTRRRLAKDAITFHVAHPNSTVLRETGPFYLVDAHNHVTGPQINDLATYARELGVLRPFEKLAE